MTMILCTYVGQETQSHSMTIGIHNNKGYNKIIVQLEYTQYTSILTQSTQLIKRLRAKANLKKTIATRTIPSPEKIQEERGTPHNITWSNRRY